MNELTTTRTLPIIATEINSIKDQTRNLILCSSIEIGRRLVEAKSLMAHGEWGNWLKTSVDYSQSTANNLMRIFEEYGADQIPLFGDNSKSQALGNLSYTQAVALLGVPAEEREEFIKTNDLEDMSTRELQEAVKKLKTETDRANNLAAALEEVSKKVDTVNDLEDENQELRETNKNLTTELSKARTDATAEVEKIKTQLQKAKDKAKAGNGSADKVKELEDKLQKANTELAELTEKLSQPVTIEPAIIEKVPEEIEQELNELRKKAEQTETDKQTNAAILKYGVYFETLVTGFKNLLEALAEIEDQEAHEKYKNAVSGLLSKMSAKL